MNEDELADYPIMEWDVAGISFKDFPAFAYMICRLCLEGKYVLISQDKTMVYMMIE